MRIVVLLVGLAAAAVAAAAPDAGPGAAALASVERPDPDALVARAVADLGRARTTGNPEWIGRAGAALDAALAAAPEHYGARRTLAWLRLARHDFAGARAAALAARAAAPGDAFALATLADACTELGAYDCAEEATTALAALKPGAVSYTRVAALRALFGDRRGAIEALEASLAATDPGNAQERAWLSVQIGLEHEALGDAATAARWQEAALALVPDHHLALPALARVRAAAGAYDAAVALLERAADRLPSFATLAALGDVEALRGDAEAARRAWDAALAAERLAAAQGASYGRDAALFLLDHAGDAREALRLARADAAARADVYTTDALAWVLHARGDDAAALRAAHRALRLGTEEARFPCHAAAISAALGRTRAAAREQRRCLALDPTFWTRRGAIARAALARPADPRLARAEGPRP